jgi:hypothetical protein
MEQGCIRITRDLKIALSKLQKRQSSRLLWVDQICIDQSNEEEKDGQISGMWDIYQSCHHAIIWLGQGAPRTDIAIDAIGLLMGPNTTDAIISKSYFSEKADECDHNSTTEEEIDDEIYQYKNLQSRKPYDHAGRSAISSIQDIVRQEKQLDMAYSDQEARNGYNPNPPPWTLGRFIISQQAKEALDFFFLLPWFSRLWIVQDVSFAPEAIMVCGSRSLDWRVCSKMIYWLHIYGSLPSPCPVAVARQWTFRKYPHISNQSEDHAEPGKPPDNPVAMMEHACCLYSSDPKDRYRALWGLLGVSRNLNDYKHPFERILFSWQFILHRSGNPLSVIANAGTRNKVHPSFSIGDDSSTTSSETWPSWAPDWNPDAISRRPRFPYGHYGTRFDASRGSEYQPPGKRNFTRRARNILFTRSISLRGKAISEVKAIYRQYTPEFTQCLEPEPSYFIHFPKAEAMQICSVVSSWFQSVWEISQSAGIEDVLRRFSTMLVSCADNFIVFENPDSCGRRLRNLFTFCEAQLRGGGFSLNFIEMRDTMNYFFTLRTCSRGQRLFVLDKMYWGLCPSETMPGDLVCILYGGKAPFVLRKCQNHVWDDDNYFLIGDCYVDGIMNGEAMGRSDFKEQMFHIF